MTNITFTTTVIMLLTLSALSAYAENGGNENGVMPANPAGQARIAKDIEPLKQESLRESLAMLSEIEMFCWPGANKGERVFSQPLDKEEGQWEVDSILSNRRFLKLYQELKVLSDAEAAEMINAEIETILPLYLEMFENEWMQVLKARKEHPVEGNEPHGAGPSLQISNNPDHSPTLSGARFKILSLLMLAGNLHLSETKSEIQKVITEAVQQRERFYQSNEATDGDRISMLTNAGLYNRQILATAVLGIQNSESDSQDCWESYDLTTFDAMCTAYDVRLGNGDHADFTKGTQKIVVHAAPDDSEFDAIISKSMTVK